MTARAPRRAPVNEPSLLSVGPHDGGGAQSGGAGPRQPAAGGGPAGGVSSARGDARRRRGPKPARPRRRRLFPLVPRHQSVHPPPADSAAAAPCTTAPPGRRAPRRRAPRPDPQPARPAARDVQLRPAAAQAARDTLLRPQRQLQRRAVRPRSMGRCDPRARAPPCPPRPLTRRVGMRAARRDYLATALPSFCSRYPHVAVKPTLRRGQHPYVEAEFGAPPRAAPAAPPRPALLCRLQQGRAATASRPARGPQRAWRRSIAQRH
jgi:hypothetical protein